MIAATHTTWVTIVGALVPSLIALIAAVTSVLNRKALKTGNDKTVGQMVTEVHGEASQQGTAFDTHGAQEDH